MCPRLLIPKARDWIEPGKSKGVKLKDSLTCEVVALEGVVWAGAETTEKTHRIRTARILDFTVSSPLGYPELHSAQNNSLAITRKRQLATHSCFSSHVVLWR